MHSIKKHLRLIAGIVLLILGIVFIMIPFLPFGYAFLFLACFFLATYIPALNKVLDYLRKKDKKGRLDNIEKKVDEIEDMIPDEEKEDDKKASK